MENTGRLEELEKENEILKEKEKLLNELIAYINLDRVQTSEIEKIKLGGREFWGYRVKYIIYENEIPVELADKLYNYKLDIADWEWDIKIENKIKEAIEKEVK